MGSLIDKGHKITVTTKQCFFIWSLYPDVGDISIGVLEWLIHNIPSLDQVLILLIMFLSIWQNKLHNIAGIILTIHVGI